MRRSLYKPIIYTCRGGERQPGGTAVLRHKAALEGIEMKKRTLLNYCGLLGVVERFSVFAATGFNAALGLHLFLGERAGGAE